MSMELLVFLKRSALPSVRDWQRSIAELDFPVELYEDWDPTNFSGFLPCKLRGTESGFEYFLTTTADIASAYPELDEVLQPFDSAVIFVWHSDLNECATALAASAALATVSSGVHFDPQDRILSDATEAVQFARDQHAAIAALPYRPPGW